MCHKINVQRSKPGHDWACRHMRHIRCWYCAASGADRYRFCNCFEMAYTNFFPASTILEITGPGYDNLTNCAKWCLNGCRDANGNQNEPGCGTSFYPPNWGDYRGLADNQDCTTAECLCNNANFDSAVAKLIESSREYCGMPISKPQAPYPPYDDMQDVFVNYCLRLGYPHHNYTAVIVGAAPTGNSSSLNGTTSTPSSMSTKQNSKLETLLPHKNNTKAIQTGQRKMLCQS